MVSKSSSTTQPPPGRPRVAYLASVYPAVSHTFVMREIMALRAHGMQVDTFSVRTPPTAGLLSAADRRERENTGYILPPRWGRLLAAHVRTAADRPLRYLSTLWFALSTRPAGLRAALWHLFYFCESVFLFHELRLRKITHLHVHFGMACATTAMITSRLGGITYSLTVHGPTIFFDAHRFLLREKVERAALVFCISDFCRSQVMCHVSPEHWHKLHIVHCGVEGNVYQPREARDRATDGTHLLCVGRLVPEKAQEVLLRAIACHRDDFPTLHGTLVGDGPDRERLEALSHELGIEDRVSLPGAVGQDDIQAYYDQADVFVLPSFAEGLPVVLMEAMAKELPAISTRIAGISELIEDQVTGRLVPPGNRDALARAIREVLEDPEGRERLARNGRRKVLAEFEMDDIGRRAAAVFRTHLGAATVDPHGHRSCEKANVACP